MQLSQDAMLRFSLILACFSLFSVPSDSLRWLLWFHDSLYIWFPCIFAWSCSSSHDHCSINLREGLWLGLLASGVQWLFIHWISVTKIYWPNCHMAAMLVRGHWFCNLSLKLTCMGMSLGSTGEKSFVFMILIGFYLCP